MNRQCKCGACVSYVYTQHEGWHRHACMLWSSTQVYNAHVQQKGYALALAAIFLFAYLFRLVSSSTSCGHTKESYLNVSSWGEGGLFLNIII